MRKFILSVAFLLSCIGLEGLQGLYYPSYYADHPVIGGLGLGANFGFSMLALFVLFQRKKIKLMPPHESPHLI